MADEKKTSEKKNWERRTLLSHGSKFRVDVNNPTVTPGGEAVYSVFSVTDDEDKSLVTHDQSGKFLVHNDKTVEIVGGSKSAESGVDVVISGRSGDVWITADKNGNIKLRGKNIILQADEDIDMQAGRNISLASGSGRVLIKGNTLEKSGLKGNLLPPEAQWAFRVFEGTGLPGGAFAALASPFGGIADLALSVAANPSSFGGLVGGAIGGALSGAVGGLIPGGAVGGLVSSVIGGNAVGGLTNFAVGAVTDIAGGAVSQATGGLIGGNALGSVLGAATGGGDIGGALSGIAGGAVSNLTGGVVSGGSVSGIIDAATSGGNVGNSLLDAGTDALDNLT